MTDFAPETETRTTCPACAAPAVAGRRITDRYGQTWLLAQCGCGVQYQLQPMTAASAARFYGEGHYRRWVKQATGLPVSETRMRTAQRAYAMHWRPQIGRYCLGRVLDYGGSTGEVSATLCPSLERVVADYGDGATVTPEQALAVPPDHYRTILCCQTLDHLPDPLGTLRQFHAVASRGAGLFCDVVKQSSTAYKLDHVTYYPTAASFVGLLERAGWTIAWVDAIRDPTHFTVWSVKV